MIIKENLIIQTLNPVRAVKMAQYFLPFSLKLWSNSAPRQK